jgi:calcium-dependent protein kinase
MDKLDFNGNGTIDYSEFMIAHVDLNKLLQEDKLKEAFELFDIDHSGSITIDEIKKVLGNGRKNDVDDAEWERILDEADSDGNGEISFDEFKAMMYKILVKQVESHEKEVAEYL